MIIIIIIIIISFMQGIYTYIPETNNVPREYIVAAVLSLLFMVPISLVLALGLYCTFKLALSEVLLLLLLLLLRGKKMYSSEPSQARSPPSAG
jgi:hypothetical protein